MQAKRVLNEMLWMLRQLAMVVEDEVVVIVVVGVVVVVVVVAPEEVQVAITVGG